jgi:hypothetical protein
MQDGPPGASVCMGINWSLFGMECNPDDPRPPAYNCSCGLDGKVRYVRGRRVP